MKAVLIDDGRMLVPFRVEALELVGDGVKEIGPEDPEYEAWLSYYRKRNQEPPVIERASLNRLQ